TSNIYTLYWHTMIGTDSVSDSVQCRLQGTPRPPAFSKDGDFVIGGVFSIHYNMHTVEHKFTSIPEPLKCTERFVSLRFSRAMIFAIEEINNSSQLLPGVKIGYEIHDACCSVPVAVKVAFQLANGVDPVFETGEECSRSATVTAIVGESGSTPSISMLRIISPFGIPQVSHFATCACLSDKKQFPTFFRTIPSDQYQAAALVHLIRHFGWIWIGAVRSDSDYGNSGMAAFLRAAHEEGICVEYSEALSRTDPRSKVKRVADVIHSSTSRVVVAFAASGDMKILLEELQRLPTSPRQWIGSEAWVTDPEIKRFGLCAGAIGFGIQRSIIPGLRDFLLDLSPQKLSSSPVLTEFWEGAFGCRLDQETAQREGALEKVCDGSEDIQQLRVPYTDTSQLRITNMVYKAVYAIAHAIHSLVCEEIFNSTVHCDRNLSVKPKQVLEKLRNVNFSRNGYHVSFDDNGDPVANYELINWQVAESGQIEFVAVGYYDASLPIGMKFRMEKEITWFDNSTQLPVSVCSESCHPGTRKAVQKGKPVCCYNCVPCPEGEISNTTGEDRCVLKPVEFLSFHEVLGIILTTCSLGGAFLAIAVAIVFYCHRASAIVRANNSELSFLLLFSLTLCFLCSLTFIGRPSEWSCMLRHTMFGITFVLCISCVLGKTILVLMAFRATLPGNNVMKWFGPAQQRLTVVSFTFVQALICTLWLILSPPFPIQNLTTYKERIILECDLGSVGAFWGVLGYIGVLAVLCFVLAFLARKLPDNFNDAKFITFSMLIFCAVWITFIPAYVSSPGKFTVAVEIFAILASSFSLFSLLFIPKCFIILFRPKQNTKKNLMVKTSNVIRF
uniref:G-protein coupled receptors family 3 profile domain-containing protein n=1 Tax=Esox lucius TaxID=8010 RepID=A0A3P8Y646_ESOLU